MLDFLKNFLDVFGSSLMFPIILLIIELIFKIPWKKAVTSALSAAIGLQGFSMVIGAYSGIISPVVTNLVEDSNINLPVMDVGWQATAVIAYATKVGMMFLPIAIFLGFFLFFIKFTDIFQPSDLWNNYGFMIWGSICYLVTNNYIVSMLLMIFLFCFSLTCGEIIEKRWSTYFNFPGCTHCSVFYSPNVFIHIALNWIEDKLGLYKIDINPKTLKKKVSILGDPMFLGFFVGMIIGILGYYKHLSDMSIWSTILTCAISTSAIMAIFPRISSIFAGAFIPLTEASKKKMKGQKGEWYLNINDAAAYGETANLISGLLAIPFVLVAAVLLPGNLVIPLVGLPSLPYATEYHTCISNGNILKTTLSRVIYAIIALYICSATAAMFTDVAVSTGYALAEGVIMITSIGTDLGNPACYLLFLIFTTQNPLFIGLAFASYAVFFVVFKKNKTKVQDWIEEQAINPGKKKVAAAN